MRNRRYHRFITRYILKEEQNSIGLKEIELYCRILKILCVHLNIGNYCEFEEMHPRSTFIDANRPTKSLVQAF